jgi:hypothetical protein
MQSILSNNVYAELTQWNDLMIYSVIWCGSEHVDKIYGSMGKSFDMSST